MAMSSPLSALQPLKGAQALASEPDGHVWLSASAGTGKTHVLTARVFRLLLRGVNPENILCLTFTKAGAAEMAERIHNRLAAWVQMPDVDLAIDLKALGEPFGPEDCAEARTLFARVLEATGGGLRIQTIHSFCQSLLSAFPLEAGLIPGFRPLEEREQKAMARAALADLLVRAEAAGDAALIGGMQALSLRLGEEKAEAFLHRCGRASDVMAALGANIRDWLFGALDLPTGDIEAQIAEACSDEAFDMAGLARIAAANAAWGSKTGLGHADIIAAWRAASPDARAAMLPDLLSVPCTAKGELRSFSAKLIDAEADYAGLCARLAERCQGLIALRVRVAYADMFARGLHAGRAYAAAYAEAKRRAGAVDFDDLIARTVKLLIEDEMAAWIRFKLDQSTDHILVDEAQDTNISQWAIVAALASDYFAGDGAKADMVRTIFTVGDFKQAIFGFQGTSPEAFGHARRRFMARAEDAEQDFHDLSLVQSFRSTPPVLELVDAVIATLGSEQLGLPPEQVRHDSAVPHPGEVILWNPVATGVAGDDEEDMEGEEDWLGDHVRAMAGNIARQIRMWIDAGLMLESKGRPIRAGDIMILVRRRSDLARLIVARLYEEGVAVAGIDRLRLNAPLAVRDLLAALRFALQPEDDLNLANLLVSPLIGWTQEELLARARREKGQGLWGHLRATLGEDEALAPLRALLTQADLTTPYRYLEHILSGAFEGRRKLLLRLGQEARDPIEELLNAALSFEGDSHPSLQRFVDWFDRGDVDIVRDAAAQGDSVRVLTVHGSKGLQAPMVILADATYDPKAGRQDGFDWILDNGDKLPVVPPRKAESVGPLAGAGAEAERAGMEEHWRLLYVALTRAEERLVVGGSLGPRAKGAVPALSWYGAVEAAMEALGAGREEATLWKGQRVWRGRETLSPKRPAPSERKGERAASPRPDWLARQAPEEARPPRPLAPSAQAEDDTPNPPPGAAMRAAAERGKCLHALYERLPAVPPAERREAAERWLARTAGIGDAARRREITESALSIIEDSAFAAIFSPDALAEAPIAAVVGEAVIAGTVDRLRVDEDRVQVVDFKTGRAIPDDPAAVPLPHIRQMAAYAAALAVIFPGRRVEAGLLYTSGPRLIMLSDALLAAHKPGFAGAQDKL